MFDPCYQNEDIDELKPKDYFNFVNMTKLISEKLQEQSYHRMI